MYINLLMQNLNNNASTRSVKFCMEEIFVQIQEAATFLMGHYYLLKLARLIISYCYPWTILKLCGSYHVLVSIIDTASPHQLTNLSSHGISTWQRGLGTPVTVRNTRPVQGLTGSKPTTRQPLPDSHRVEGLVMPIKYCKFTAAILN